MTRITLAFILLALTPAVADAHAKTLTLHRGHVRVAHAVAWDIADTPGATGRVGKCWHYDRRTVACDIRETGITFGGIDGWTWESVYVARAAQKGVTIG